MLDSIFSYALMTEQLNWLFLHSQFYFKKRTNNSTAMDCSLRQWLQPIASQRTASKATEQLQKHFIRNLSGLSDKTIVFMLRGDIDSLLNVIWEGKDANAQTNLLRMRLNWVNNCRLRGCGNFKINHFRMLRLYDVASRSWSLTHSLIKTTFYF